MIDKETAAALSLRAYDQDVRLINLPLVPNPWAKLPNPTEGTKGFGYGLFRNESTREIVIAYRGTDAVMGWDGLTDAALFLGFATSQALQAAKAYRDVLREYGPNINVTFTGHSLGGGLASMMAVWFARPAIVFDSAPFEAAAVRPDVIEWVKRELGSSAPPELLAFDPATNLVIRESRVESHYASGEFLKELTLRGATTGLYALPEYPLDFGPQRVNMFTMHSQALLTAGLLTPALAMAAARVEAALPLIMSSQYYSPDTAGLTTKNFLLDLIRSEQASPGNGKLTHFAADLNKLGTNLAGLNVAAQNALIAQAIEWYYWQGANYAGQEFFTPANGALQYATAQGDALAGAMNKAAPYTRLWLNPSSNFRTTAVPAFAQWNVATASSGSAAAARDPNKNQLFLGGVGGDRFTGGALSDLMLGGAGDDTYVVGRGRDRVQDDLSGQGRILTASGQVLAGGRGNGSRGGWVGANGEVYHFTPTHSATLGTLTISNLGAGNDVKIEKFDYAQAISTGYLGVHLDDTFRVALVKGGTSRFWREFSATLADIAYEQATLFEGGGSVFTVALVTAAKAGERLALNLFGFTGLQLKLVNGATTVDAENAVIELEEGQTEVSFALVQEGGLSDHAVGSFSVTYQSADGDYTPSNEWELTLQDLGQTTRSFIGDQRPRISGTSYVWAETEWATDGTLINGVYEGNFADVLYATTGNDKLDGRGGNDAFAAGAGHDEIDGGAGDDLIGGGSGSDVINGGDGNDFISSSGNSNAPLHLKTTDAWVPPAGAIVKASGATWGVYSLNGSTVWQGMGATLVNGDGDSVDAGAGNDTVIASWGDDRVKGGDGNDQVDGLAGADVVEGGLGDDFLQGDGSVRTGQLNSVSAANHGADFVDGGDGADVVLGGGNADQLFGGAGDDQIAGDSSGPTTSSSYVDLAYHGADYLDGEAGNDYLEGGAGEDVLYGGAGHDTLWGDTSASFVALASHNALVWANDYLDGEDGNDTLIGGGKDDQLFGGLGDDMLWGDERTLALAPEYQGEDYLDGEDGADFLEGGGSADTLFGGAGNDTLWGDSTPTALAGTAHGDDYLDGEDGDDMLIGNGGADELYGGAGNDTLLGDSNGGDLAAQFHGADYLDGGEGNDLLVGDGGSDLLAGGSGDDQLQGGADDDELLGGDGLDLLFGEAGNDTLSGEAGDDQLMGGLGDDVLMGGEGLNRLYGQEGNDTLIGGSMRDQLQGGLGDDILSGGGGDDIYYYRLGEGEDHITDSGGFDRLVFVQVTKSAIGGFNLGSLRIMLPDGGSVHLDDFDPEHPLDGSIEVFQFADGTFTRQELIESLGFDITGTPQEDALQGTALGDRISALAGGDVVAAGAGDDAIDLGDGSDILDAGDGNDLVQAGAGDDYVRGGAGNDSIDGGDGADVLEGGAGNDQLVAGAGDDLLAGQAGTDTLRGGDGTDTYSFGLGDGADTAFDAGANAIQLGAGIDEGQVRLSRAGQDLIVALAGTADRLTVKDWFVDPAAPWTLGLADGRMLDRAAIEERIALNQPPVLGADTASVSEDGVTVVSGNVLANDADPEGRGLRVTTPGDLAGDYGAIAIDADGFFTYVLDNASPTVQSLAQGQVTADTFGYTASDDDPAGAATSSATLTVSVRGANDAPLVTADSAQAAEDDSAPATGNLLANDSDVDAGTHLQVADAGVRSGTYGVLNLAPDGSYAYAVNNAAAQVQALGRAQQGIDRFAFAVNDGVVNVGSELTVTVSGRNDAPTVAIALPDQTAATSGNTSYSWQVPAGSFVDADAGDILRYGARLADGSPLPSWLAFDATTATFSGRVPRTATGALDIEVMATDAVAGGADLTGSLSAADVFRLTFAESGGGGGGGGGGGAGGGQGNEGLGNGEDAPPPGHDSSFNDGPGTSPGDPGARGGRWHPDDAPAATQVTSRGGLDEHAAPVAIAMAERDGVHGASLDGAPSAAAEDAGHPGNGNGPLRDAPLDAGGAAAAQPVAAVSSAAASEPRLGQDAPDDVGDGGRTRPAIVAAREGETAASPADTYMPAWAAMDERLLGHLAQDAGGSGDGFEVGMSPAGASVFGSAPWVRDPLSRAGDGHPLAVFSGLKEGLRQSAL